MKKYYYNNYRGFANEFTVISVDQSNEKEVKEFDKFYSRFLESNNVNWDLHRITAKRANEIVAHERALYRHYKKVNYIGEVGATEITTATEFFELWRK